MVKLELGTMFRELAVPYVMLGLIVILRFYRRHVLLCEAFTLKYPQWVTSMSLAAHSQMTQEENLFDLVMQL